MPKPKVNSSVIKLTRNKVSDLGCNYIKFVTIVKTSFSQRRKKLQNIGKNLGIEIKSDERLEEMTNDKIINFAKKIRKI